MDSSSPHSTLLRTRSFQMVPDHWCKLLAVFVQSGGLTTLAGSGTTRWGCPWPPLNQTMKCYVLHIHAAGLLRGLQHSRPSSPSSHRFSPPCQRCQRCGGQAACKRKQHWLVQGTAFSPEGGTHL